MALVTMTWHGNGIRLLAEATEALGSPTKGRHAFAMALNKTVTTVNANVKRDVAAQMGTSQRNVVKHGGMKIKRASSANLAATIDVRGGYMPLKDFGPRQTKKGVSAAAWNVRRVFGGTFLNKGARAATGIGPVGRASAGGHVFKNTGKFNKVSKRNNAIEALWGPAVPREVVRDESEATFYRIADARMPTEIERAVRALTKGVVS